MGRGGGAYPEHEGPDVVTEPVGVQLFSPRNILLF